MWTFTPLKVWLIPILIKYCCLTVVLLLLFGSLHIGSQAPHIPVGVHQPVLIFAKCQSFETWEREKVKLLKVEAANKKFEQILTNVSAASKRIDIIDNMVKDFEDTGHNQLKIMMQQKQICDQWVHLNCHN